ncbi:MAG: hypothetical protein IPG28_12635 [Betaproteobacteria bacterium]|nr:hypothetical protein [Betaproteobacteria bacterium]
MTPAEWTALGGALAALVAAVSAALWRRRRTQIDGWVTLVREMQRRLDDLHEAIVAAEGRITAATERAEAAEELAQKAQSQATRLGVLHDALVDHVEALWEWIEAGATPPAPVIPSVLKPYLQLPRLSRTTEPSP